MGRWCLVALVCLAGTGCAWMFRAPTPIATIRYPAADAGGSELLVLLPGRGDRARSFAEAGIVDLVRRERPSLDVVAVDATFGYYIHRNLPERVRTDVVEPARAHGYRSVWVAGISMGGLGAALFAEKNPGAVQGVLLLAPFLGDEPVIAEIEAAGGLRSWAPAATIEPDDYQHMLWRWLKGCTTAPASCPQILLGFGSSDRFVRAHRLLAAALPADHVVTVPGGHDWGPWRGLFTAFLPKLGN
jgi:pimeloyl-ACP methyl ester carboxylesterase